ncbi:MAG: histidine kinase [Geminicoccaceae bacterium]
MDDASPRSSTFTAAGFWQSLSLAQRFALTGGLVMLVGTAIVGSWVASRIEAGVTRNTAGATAMYVDSVIAPLSQGLQRTGELSDGAIRALDEVLASPSFAGRVVSFKIWLDRGNLAYATDPTLRGQSFPVGDALRTAWSGEIVADLLSSGDIEHAPDSPPGTPLLEIYSPIREVWSGRVIAVAEFYEDASELQANLAAVRLESWLVVGAVTATTAIALFGIVLTGSRTIETQRQDLQHRVAELGRLATQNRILRLQVQRASSRTSEINERQLRRISAELHDGPAQLVGFAALRLESIAAEPDQERRLAEIGRVRGALAEALRDLRATCRGLALPDIDGMGLNAVLGQAVEAHRKRTDAQVELVVDGDLTPAELPSSLRLCAYRFVQESLNNVHRHAADAAARVIATLRDGVLRLAVEDGGPGPAAKARNGRGSGMGLAGLRDRVEALGGAFAIDGVEGTGMRVAMEINLEEVRGDG